MIYWRYWRYLLRHKWFVLLAGLHIKAPLWRLLIHDWSKFLPSEFFPYARFFYGFARGEQPPEVQAAFDRAWLFHQHRNPHHWQFWVLQQDDGVLKVVSMPERLVREMVADWMGAGRAITGRWEVREWYAKNQDKIHLHYATRELVEKLIA